MSQVIVIVGVVVSALLLGVSLLGAANEIKIRPRLEWARVVVGLGGVLVMGLVIGSHTPLPFAIGAIVVGGVLGLMQGQNTVVTVKDTGLWAKRGVWAIILWSAGLIGMQLAGLGTRAGAFHIGQTVALFSVSVTVGLIFGRSGPQRAARAASLGTTALVLLAAVVAGFPQHRAHAQGDGVTLVTGEVQVTLTWTGIADLDLYVLEPQPEGSQISFGNRTGTLGGALDVDSNAACRAGSGSFVENIAWEAGTPDGQFEIWVDNWSSCDSGGGGLQGYRIEIRANGEVVVADTGRLGNDADSNRIRIQVVNPPDGPPEIVAAEGGENLDRDPEQTGDGSRPTEVDEDGNPIGGEGGGGDGDTDAETITDEEAIAAQVTGILTAAAMGLLTLAEAEQAIGSVLRRAGFSNARAERALDELLGRLRGSDGVSAPGGAGSPSPAGSPSAGSGVPTNSPGSGGAQTPGAPPPSSAPPSAPASDWIPQNQGTEPGADPSAAQGPGSGATPNPPGATPWYTDDAATPTADAGDGMEPNPSGDGDTPPSDDSGVGFEDWILDEVGSQQLDPDGAPTVETPGPMGGPNTRLTDRNGDGVHDHIEFDDDRDGTYDRSEPLDGAADGEENSTTVTEPDGTTVVTEPNDLGGTTRTTTRPDGTVITESSTADGRESYEEVGPDGSRREGVVRPDGSGMAGVDADGDGHYEQMRSTDSDGTTTTLVTGPDGTVTTTRTDRDGGVIEAARRPDGSAVHTTTGPGGTTTTVTDADGTVTETQQLADGRRVTAVTRPDGSAERVATLPDGTVIENRTNPDGSWQETVHPSDGGPAETRIHGTDTVPRIGAAPDVPHEQAFGSVEDVLNQPYGRNTRTLNSDQYVSYLREIERRFPEADPQDVLRALHADEYGGVDTGDANMPVPWTWQRFRDGGEGGYYDQILPELRRGTGGENPVTAITPRTVVGPDGRRINLGHAYAGVRSDMNRDGQPEAWSDFMRWTQTHGGDSWQEIMHAPGHWVDGDFRWADEYAPPDQRHGNNVGYWLSEFYKDPANQDVPASEAFQQYFGRLGTPNSDEALR